MIFRAKNPESYLKNLAVIFCANIQIFLHFIWIFTQNWCFVDDSYVWNFESRDNCVYFWRENSRWNLVVNCKPSSLRSQIFENVENVIKWDCLGEFSNTVTPAECIIVNSISVVSFSSLFCYFQFVRGFLSFSCSMCCTLLEKSNFCPKIQFWQNPRIFTTFSIFFW